MHSFHVGPLEVPRELVSVVFLCLEKDHASALSEVYFHTSKFFPGRSLDSMRRFGCVVGSALLQGSF